MPAAAAGPEAVAALPRERMAFVQDDDAGKNDKILVYSMVGILVLTGLVFGINHFTKQESAPIQTTPAVAVPDQRPAAVVVDKAPEPAWVPQSQLSTPTYQSAPAAQTPVQPQYTPPAAPMRDSSMRPNRKMKLFQDITEER